MNRHPLLFLLRSATWLTLAADLYGNAASGANLQISPVLINLRAGQSAAGITLQNLGEAPMTGQVRVFLWDQKDGEDVLTPTREVLASPPLVEIAPNGRQIIRLVRQSQAGAGAGERSYRVLIDELARDDGSGNSGVDIRLRYSVPVFVSGPGQAGKEKLGWIFFRNDGAWMLRLQNSGDAHAQIGALSVANRTGKHYVISQGLFGYVLAGRSREWRLPVPQDADLSGALVLTARVNAKVVTDKNTPQE